MPRPYARFAAALALAALLPACDAFEQQNAFRLAALAEPSGITRTDTEGNVLDTDPNDWRVSPLYGPAADIRVSVVSPAYPNPAQEDDLVTLRLLVEGASIPGGLSLVGLVEQDGRLRYVELDPGQPGQGFVDFAFRPAQQFTFAQGGGLRRLVVFDGQGEPVTYGDLLIE